MVVNNALVSIIVPVYNTAEYVEECIQSVLSQSYENIELILVNDGSTDGSGKICMKYGQDKRIKYVEQINSGVQVARKRGVEASAGEWIMFVDSDDTLPNNSVDNLLSASKDVDIVVGRHFKQVSWKEGYCDSKDYLNMIYHKIIYTAPWAKLFKGDLVRQCKLAFEYNIPRSQDYLMNLAIACDNKKIVALCHHDVYCYRTRNNSTCHLFKHHFDYMLRLCDMADAILSDSFSKNERILASIDMRMRRYRQALKENDYKPDKHNPCAKDIIRRMNEARVFRLSDRMLLLMPDRKAVKVYLFLSKYIRRFKRRFKNPSLLIKVFI